VVEWFHMLGWADFLTTAATWAGLWLTARRFPTDAHARRVIIACAIAVPFTQMLAARDRYQKKQAAEVERQGQEALAEKHATDLKNRLEQAETAHTAELEKIREDCAASMSRWEFIAGIPGCSELLEKLRETTEDPKEQSRIDATAGLLSDARAKNKDQFKALCDRKSDARACHNYAWVLDMVEGKSEDAIPYYNKGCQRGQAWSCQNLGTLYSKQGDRKTAFPFFKAGCKLKLSESCAQVDVRTKQSRK
jgi:TPR repeat protein